MRRAWTYLQERFPLPAHGPVVAAFSGGIVCASAALRGAEGPGWGVVAVAFVVALGTFFQLRVADEWKDAERDRQYQPERPVPRGLVTLRELTLAALAVALLQLVVVVWLDVRLVAALAALWAWIGLMTIDFFVPAWLDARPLATLALHGLVVPAVDGFAVATDVVAHGAGVEGGVAWLVGVSFFGGNVIEIGRKLRASPDERPGVATYTAAWGRTRAIVAWMLAVVLSAACGTGVLASIGGVEALVPLLWLAAAVVLGVGATFLASDVPGRGRRMETVAGVWTLALYLTIGPLALLLR